MAITHTKRQQNELGAVLKDAEIRQPESTPPSLLTAGCVEQSHTLTGFFLLEAIKGSTEVSLALFKTVANSFFAHRSITTLFARPDIPAIFTAEQSSFSSY